MEDYKNKIENSKSNHVPISEIWGGTTKVEKIGLTSCKEHYKWKGYKLTHEPKKYHPDYDLKFSLKDDDLLIEVKTELYATGVLQKHTKPYTYDTCFVEYFDKSKGTVKPSGLALTKADLYWFHTGAGIFVVPTEQVKEWGRDETLDHVWGGINRDSKGFKLPIDFMRDYALKD